MRLLPSFLFNDRDQLLSGGRGHAKPGGPSENWTGNGVEFRRISLLHIFLHGTAHARRIFARSCDYGFGIDLCAFGHRDCTSFAHDADRKLPPFRIAQYLPDGRTSGGCGQSKRGEEYEFAPHQRRFVVDEAAFKAELLKTVKSRTE